MALQLLGSGCKFVLSLVALGVGLYLGWQQAKEKEGVDKVPVMAGVMLSTLSPIGLALYVVYWESKPAFSSACGKQALLGLVCYAVFRLVAGLYPATTW